LLPGSAFPISGINSLKWINSNSIIDDDDKLIQSMAHNVININEMIAENPQKKSSENPQRILKECSIHQSINQAVNQSRRKHRSAQSDTINSR